MNDIEKDNDDNDNDKTEFENNKTEILESERNDDAKSILGSFELPKFSLGEIYGL